jgi:two-component system, sensor histidine kinase RegB
MSLDALRPNGNLGPESGLKLTTATRLRWFAVAGQVLALAVVYFAMGFDLPLGLCLIPIALSAWLNVYLDIRYPATLRLSNRLATGLLAYDIAQLAALLYLTGGIENPFVFLIVAPVTVAAATLPVRNTLLLGALTAALSIILVDNHWPLPWHADATYSLPDLLKWGMLASIGACMVFLALYVYRLSQEAQQMSAALAATEAVLAREQQLHALDGLAAAAAHELGTPLGTIVLVAKDLAKSPTTDKAMAEDLALLQQQALRCKEILQTLTKRQSERDPTHAELTITQLVNEAAEPHLFRKSVVTITSEPHQRPTGDDDSKGWQEPIGERLPGVIYGVGNLIENAVDFAANRVDVAVRWSPTEVSIMIRDDGPGFPPDVLDRLGDPYVTTRPSVSAQRRDGRSGLGLGFFIAKTLLERSGAALQLDNREPSEQAKTGAVVTVRWPRSAFPGPSGNFVRPTIVAAPEVANLSAAAR